MAKKKRSTKKSVGEPKLTSGTPMDLLEKRIDAIAISLLMLDPTDMPALTALHDLFGGLQSALHQQGSPFAVVSSKCANLVEKMIMREVVDAGAATKLLIEAMSTLQSVIKDKQDSAQVKFPAELCPGEQSPVAAKLQSIAKPETALAVKATSVKATTAAPAAVKAGPVLMSFKGADASLVAEFIIWSLIAELRDIIADPDKAAADAPPDRVGEILVDMGATTYAALEPA